MPVVTTDLVCYTSLNHPEDDTSTNGGAINLDERVVFVDLASNDDVEVFSSNPADTTQTATIWLRNAAGAIVTQGVTLNGTTAVIFSTAGVGERVERFALSADCAGTVTVRRSVAGATIAEVPPGERGFRRLFISAVSAAGAKDYYQKVFWRNNHATLSALGATVVETSDPSGLCSFTLGNAVNDSVTQANRLTAPGAGDTNPDTFDGTSKGVPGTDLAAGAAIACYVKLALGSNQVPIKTTYTLTMNCTTA